MNKFLKTYIRNRNLALIESDKNSYVYEIDYLNQDLINMSNLFSNAKPQEIKKIYEKMPTKFIDFLNDPHVSGIKYNEQKFDYLITMIITDNELFEELTHVGLISLMRDWSSKISLFIKLLEKIMSSNIFHDYNMLFFSIILSIMEMFISDNHNNKGFSIPNIFKIFFKKYISIHNIERPDRLVLRIENMKKIMGDE